MAALSCEGTFPLTRLRELTSLLVLPLILLSACSESDQQAEGGRPGFGGPGGGMVTRVITEPVKFRQNSDQIESVGTARAQQAATIFPQAGGEVLRVHFEPGQYIKAGAPLITLESAEERLDVAQAKVTLQDAQQLLSRYERIDVDGAISESQIDAAKTAVEAAQIGLELAQEALNKRTVRAPFSGYVGLTNIDAGAMVTTQTELTRLDDRSMLFVDFALPEQVFGRLKEGDTIPMTPFAAEQNPVQAEISFVDSRIDADRRSFMVRATVDNNEDLLRPGMSFRIQYSLPGMSFPSVPEAAIVWGGDGPYLWEVIDGKAQRVPVTIISRQDGQVLVRAPLERDDLIISEGVQKVRQGSEVKSLTDTIQSDRPAVASTPATSAALQ